MTTFLLVLHAFTCLILVFVVLIQSGKEGGIGAAWGGGSSQSVFGSSGGANFFTKFTSGVAAIFMVTSILLSAAKGGRKTSVFSGAKLPETTTTSAPATTAAPEATAPATTEAAKPAAAEAKPAHK